MFRDYPYVSGTASTTRQHFADYARSIERDYLPDHGSVVEIGSNDGTLLRAFSQAHRRLGVDPARNVAAIAVGAGVETVAEFFDEAVAARIAEERGHAHAIIANNVVPHIDDLHGLVRGICALLAPQGVFVAEFPYVPDLLERVEYDTIYHEHLSYFSLRSVSDLFARNDLTVFDAVRMSVHGGSVRVFAGRDRPTTDRLRSLLAEEERRMLETEAPFHRFASLAMQRRDKLRDLLQRLRTDGSVAGYGAAAKGNTLLNFCRLDTELIAYIADLNPLKHGLLTPGSHIPIRPSDALAVDAPRHLVILAWNFAEEIIAQHSDYARAGGRFVVPIPSPRVV